MPQPRVITAIGTPLTEDDQLHVEGLARHLDDQAAAGIDSILAAGTMGLMPLLSDATWRDLVQRVVELGRGRFELLVGATDASTARALDRVAFVNTIDGIDGTVVMVPGTFKFTDAQYIDYFTDLANASRYPLYLYDLQPLTGVHLAVQTVVKLAEHPNIAGIKLSANVPDTAILRKDLNGAPFRIIVAEPVLCDMLFRHGYHEHLDGIFAVTPHWAAALVEAAGRGDWDAAATWQKKLTGVKELFMPPNTWLTFTALMNLRGLPGKYAPRPLPQPDAAFIEQFRQKPLVQEMLSELPQPAPAVAQA